MASFHDGQYCQPRLTIWQRNTWHALIQTRWLHGPPLARCNNNKENSIDRASRGGQISKPVKAGAIPAKVDMRVGPSEIFSIFGHSGAGKSPLIRNLNLLQRRTSGLVQVGRVDLLASGDEALEQFRRGVDMIFQYFNLLGSQTVVENVALPQKIAGKVDEAAADQQSSSTRTRMPCFWRAINRCLSVCCPPLQPQQCCHA